MASVGMERAHDENNGELVMTSPGGKTTIRKRKMEERDENSLGETHDFEWENSKENVMPLKRGRVVDDLNRALRTQESFQGKAKVDHEAKEMEARVHAYEGPDPLSAWVKYIKWIETNMPEDTRKKFGALERCTRELKDHAQYKDDLRYVRLWVQYADFVSNPKDIFKYLYQNKIGEHVALFYVGWALVLESMANYAQAHKVYLKATQKNAQPEELLTRKYKEFQRRMSRHWLKVRNSDPSDTSADESQRFALDDISTDGADIQRFGNSENFRRYAQAQAEKMLKANAHKPAFSVYEDPAGTEVDTLAPAGEWKKLGTVRHQNKENDTAPTRWNNGPLRAEAAEEATSFVPAAAQPPSPALQVFVDEEFASSESAAPSIAGRDRSLTLRQRLEGASTEEEQLLQQPLKNFTSEKPKSTETAKPPRVAKQAKVANEKFAYKESLTKSSSGEVMCFEEIRARKFAAKVSRAKQLTASGNRFLAEQPTRESSSGFLQVRSLQASTPILAQPPRVVELHAPVMTRPIGEQSDVSDEYATLNAAAQEDMTINTRLAMEDVNSMFCSPSRETKQPVVPATVWEVPEPVERKLHFSIFDDSVDSIALNPHDMSLRTDGAEQVAKNSFQVFSDDAPAVPAPRTASKPSARKPLMSRDDLARRSRLTNKDMLMKADTDIKPDDERESVHVSVKGTMVKHVEKPTKRELYQKEDRPSTKTGIQANSHREKKQQSVNPYHPATRQLMIESPAVELFAASNSEMVHWHTCKTPSLWSTNQQRRKLKKTISFHLDEKVEVEVVGFLGSGAFAQVFSVKVEGLDPAPKTMALKLEKTKGNLLWELYITEQIRQRSKFLLRSGLSFPVPSIRRLDVFKNGTTLIMEKAPAGTLHDLLNAYRKAGKPFPETLAIHYAIQMIYIVETLHEANVLHGDIKPDNWLLIPTGQEIEARTPGAHAATIKSSSGGLCLIDFGRSIDMEHYPDGTLFHGDCHVKGFQTIEMMTKRPWTTQIDTFGICSTVHCMLFGEYMEVKKRVLPDGKLRWSPSQGFKRYWQVGMWKAFFDAFLNVKSCSNQPSLATHRRTFERFFLESPHRRDELRELLASQDRMLSKPKV